MPWISIKEEELCLEVKGSPDFIGLGWAEKSPRPGARKPFLFIYA